MVGCLQNLCSVDSTHLCRFIIGDLRDQIIIGAKLKQMNYDRNGQNRDHYIYQRNIEIVWNCHINSHKNTSIEKYLHFLICGVYVDPKKFTAVI